MLATYFSLPKFALKASCHYKEDAAKFTLCHINRSLFIRPFARLSKGYQPFSDFGTFKNYFCLVVKFPAIAQHAVDQFIELFSAFVSFVSCSFIETYLPEIRKKTSQEELCPSV